jgi:hypothetical protein
VAYTQADLDALDVDIAKIRIVQSTSFADQSATFRKLDELLALRAVMAATVNTAGRTRYAAVSKGV